MTPLPDVIIVGTGPAGASAALQLAGEGHTVWVFAGHRSAASVPGETLPPQIRRELAKLGASTLPLGEHGLCSYGIEARWGGREHFHSHVFDADGDGWHVEPVPFRRALMDEARTAGATILQSARLRHVVRTGQSWTVTFSRPGNEVCDVRCRFLIDATGRASMVARMVGTQRQRFDALCGVAAAFARTAMPQTLSVQSAPYGWWYVAPIPNERVVACLISDADIIRSIGAHHPRTWRALLAATRLSGVGAVPAASALRVQTLPCEMSILEPPAGPGWLAVGDAASVFDPLAAAGVMKALHTGRTGARAVAEYLSTGADAALMRYCREAVSGFRRHLADRQTQYRLETRWSDRTFWRRHRGEITHSVVKPTT